MGSRTAVLICSMYSNFIVALVTVVLLPVINISKAKLEVFSSFIISLSNLNLSLLEVLDKSFFLIEVQLVYNINFKCTT